MSAGCSSTPRCRPTSISTSCCSKHFAVLGTTGVGKSTAVALILRAILEKKANLRIFLIDPHNEYGHCFGDLARVVSPKNLAPALLAVQFRGDRRRLLPRPAGRRGGDRDPLRADPDRQGEIRRGAARRPRAAPQGGRRRLHRRHAGALPHLRSRRAHQRPHGQAREPLVLDEVPPPDHAHRNARPRLALRLHVRQPLRRGHDGQGARRSLPPAGQRPADHRHAARRLPGRGRRLGRLGALPLAFEFGVWSDGAVPVLVACEEAHRYAPADRKLGFGPTRKALSRIAKEGRKYSVFLGVVTQRPADLDATILSQCSTVFAMRMANERDQAIVNSAVPDAGSSLDRLPRLARHPRGDRLRRRRAAADALPLRGPRRGIACRAARRKGASASRSRTRSTPISSTRSSTAGARRARRCRAAAAAPMPPLMTRSTSIRDSARSKLLPCRNRASANAPRRRNRAASADASPRMNRASGSSRRCDAPSASA